MRSIAFYDQWRWLLLLSLLSLIFSSPLAATEKITIQLKWFHQFQFAGFYAAKEKGFFLEEGLDVTLKQRNPKTSHIEDVLEGKAHYGVADAGLVLSRLQGKPVVLLSQIFQHSPLVFLTLKSSGIRTPYDLIGKRVMADLKGNSDAPLNAMLLKTLGHLNSVKIIPHSYQNQDLLHKKVDAMDGYLTDQPYWFEQRDHPVTIIDPRDYGIDFYGDNLFTIEEEIQNHPQRVKRVIRAVKRGWSYALEHTEEIIALILKKYDHRNLNRDHLRFEAVQTKNIILPQFIQIGTYESSRFQKMAEIYALLGFSKTSEIDQGFFYQNAKKIKHDTEGRSVLKESNAPHIILTAEEKRWIFKNPRIRVHNETAWPPFNFAVNGQPQGISIDFMNLLAKKVGLKINYITGPSWNEFLMMMKKKELDVMLNIVKTPERQKYLRYTPPYANNPNVILSREDQRYNSFEQLIGKTVSVPKGFFYEEILKRDHPKVNILPLKNTLDTMKAVRFGDADAALGELAVLTHLMAEHVMSGLVVSGEVRLGDPELALLNIATRKDLPILASILVKGVKSITMEERRRILKKWMGDSQEKQAAEALERTRDNWWIIIGVITVFLFLLIGALFLPYIFSDEILARHFGSVRFRWMALTGMSLIIIMVSLLVWYTLIQHKKNKLASVSSELKVVLRSVMERNDSWVRERLNLLTQLGRDLELVAITKRLLKVPAKPETLKDSQPLREIRAFVAKREKEFGKIGFFVISPEAVSIASRRDENLGSKNLIAEQKPELLAQIFRGQSLFIPPIRSDVLLFPPEEPDKQKTTKRTEKPLTMFFAVPIRNAEGEVIAALTQRLAPLGQMSQIMRGGQIGRSGESYVIDPEGRLITKSRFVIQLYDIGLLKRGEESHTLIEMRDPGGNLLEGYQPSISRTEQPFTRMTQDIFRLGREMVEEGSHTEHSQMMVDITGYRDYRGVPVFGAWIWSAHLGLGLATEINVDEALSGYYSLRQNLFIITGVTLLLSILATLLTIILGERATRIMRRTQEELEERVVDRTRELNESQERFELTVRGSGDALWEYDARTKENWFSPRFIELLQYEKDELEHTLDAWKRHVHPKDRKRAVAAFEKHLKDDTPYDIEYRMRTKSDQYRWFRARAKSLRNNQGWAYRTSGTISDITEHKKAEEELKQKRALMQSLFDSIPDLLFAKDPNGTYLHSNTSFDQFVGRKKKEIIGKTDYDLFPEDVAEFFRNEDKKMLAKGESRRNEEWVNYADGRRGLLDTLKTPFQAPDGTVLGLLGISRDITERKEAEDELAESQERLEMALKGGNLGFWDVDFTTGRTIINDRYKEIFGYPKEEVMPITRERWLQTIHPDDLEEVKKIGAEYRQGRRDEYEIEYRTKALDGSQKWVISKGSTVERDEKGNPIRMVGTILDISERKEFEIALQRAKEEAEAATRAKSDFLANMSHEIRTPMNAIIGMSHLALQTELSAKQRDYITKTSNAANALLGIINDILDFSKIEAGKMAMESVPFELEEVLKNLANLTTVKTYEKGLEFLISVGQNVPEELIGDPLRLGQILINLTNNAVKFTKKGEVVMRVRVHSETETQVTLQFAVQDSGIGMNAAQVSRLFQAFSQADTSTTRQFGGTGLGLTISKRFVEMMKGRIWVESEPGVGSTFRFTARFGKQKTKQSRRYTVPETLGDIRILVVDDHDESREILCNIIHTYGLVVEATASAPQAIDQLVAAMEKGTPFDLVIMDYQMPQMDGLEATQVIQNHPKLTSPPKIIMVTAHGRDDIRHKIEQAGLAGFLLKPVSSSVLYDAIVCGVFGVCDISKQKQVHANLGLEVIQSIRGANVLLVEDNEVNQQVATELLQQAQLIVSIAADGQEAVDRVKKEDFDAILMDIQMPVMDGYEATKVIRQNLQIINLPIIAMTANAMTGDREKCLNAGMNDHVAKPIDPKEMYGALARWIKPGMRTIPERSISSETVDNLKKPLDLPGFDCDTALMRVGGNWSAYRKILQKVLASEADVIDRIQKSLEADDIQGAERAAHTLKGVSGTIGATMLQSVAAELEACFRGEADDQKVLSSLMQQVEETLAETLLIIQQALQSSEIVTQNQSYCVADVQEKLALLQEQIDNFDSSAEETAAVLLDLLKASPLVASAEQLNAALASYAFDHAQEHLEEIQHRLGDLESQQHGVEELSVAEQNAALKSIAERIDLYDSAAQEAVERLIEKVSEPQLRTSLLQLKKSLSEYDFDAAAFLLTQLLQDRLS
ncbi:response regulator [Magnetococcales bacterium HHB-1]